jgi:hypothetical protein
MVPDIIYKLQNLTSAGVTSEAHVVYLLASIRKIIEQEDLVSRFKYLNFHCNWALHSKLDRKDAQEVLVLFDGAHKHLINGNKGSGLPHALKGELDKIFRMKLFQIEIEKFLSERNIPSLSASSSDGWIHFLYHYFHVVEDCPLVIQASNSNLEIKKVTIRVDVPNHDTGAEKFFRVVWQVEDKTGAVGSHEIYNSYSLERG